MIRDAFVFALIDWKWRLVAQYRGDERIAGKGSFERACRAAQDHAEALREEHGLTVNWETDRAVQLDADYYRSRVYGPAIVDSIVHGRNLDTVLAIGQYALAQKLASEAGKVVSV